MPSIQHLQALREFFNSGKTKPFEFRELQLRKLKDAIVRFEQRLYDALYADLKKSPEECWVTENGFVISEINHALKHLHSWMKPRRTGTNLLNFPSSSFVLAEPLGVVLIISPWNYPFQLLFTPLVGAIAAGNCVVLKSSEFAPATSAVMRQLVAENFEKEFILFTEGDGAVVIPEMMDNFIFDHVFYTGSTAVGKLVYQMAANNLVPATLELGGKSPAVVESDADLKTTAKRIAMTKFSNAGQMCVAPDYLLVHRPMVTMLITELKQVLTNFFGDDPSTHENYGKIINEKQFDRLSKYLSNGEVVHGGKTDRTKLYIEPTIITGVTIHDQVMKEEIFGPILPIISFQTADEALAIIRHNNNPLAFYVFTSNREKEDWWLKSVPFGGGCVNNASWHLTNHSLPFGGRGTSGTGSYHGKYSFDTFSHRKSVMKTPTWFDPSMKYPPFKGKLKLFKWMIK